jgi:hypothetical protein
LLGSPAVSLDTTNDIHVILKHESNPEWLLNGVPMEDVQILLGHIRLEVTENSDSPWVKARNGGQKARFQTYDGLNLSWVELRYRGLIDAVAIRSMERLKYGGGGGN